jgi:cob(I)alamin adenosyltransferase
LPRIYTRTGDAGETGLFDGTRVAKSDPRVDAYGNVDELASWLGLVRSHVNDRDLIEILDRTQRDLFALGAVLADPRHRIAPRVEKVVLDEGAVVRLEQWIDALEAGLPPLRRFILAGGGAAGAGCTWHEPCAGAPSARSWTRSGRRASHGVTYINRLSDLLFTMARAANNRAGVPEVEW